MSLHSFQSDEDDRGSIQENHRAVDELAEYYPKNAGQNPSIASTGNKRVVNLILDHSAFVRGIGNIKRWFNEQYVKTNYKRITKNEKVYLNIYIPTYTLHEFDFVKKGTSMTATNAREAIRFIEKIFESEQEHDQSVDVDLLDSTQTNNESKKKQFANPITYNVMIESTTVRFPSWNECLKYKVHTPKIKEFPNFKTKFDSNLIGQHPDATTDSFDEFSNDFNSTLKLRNKKLNDIQYENSQSYQDALARSDDDAEMPVRLRYLIRSCIHKRFVETKNQRHPKISLSSPLEQWKLVTEDPITKVWAKSFGIDCLNVNEAELLIFQFHDINHFRLYEPNLNFNAEHENINDEPEGGILHSTIDTTLYSYTSLDSNKKSTARDSSFGKKNKRSKKKSNEKKPQPPSVEGVVPGASTQAGGDIVKRERFDAINYAPRGSGKLWRPS